MRRVGTLIFFLLLSVTGPYAQASSLTVIAGDLRTDAGSPAVPDADAIILTFGYEYVVVHDLPLHTSGGRLIAEGVSRERLFVVRDLRPAAERLGYKTLYSHWGFRVVEAEDPERLAGVKHLYMRPITESRIVTQKTEAAALVPDPAVKALIAKLSAARYSLYMANLAKAQPTRYACSGGEVAARDKIKAHFLSLGLETSTRRFNNICDQYCKDVDGFNVIGIKRGTVRPNEYYLVGAHYDSISGVPCSQAPGANDNASGVAGVMELARIFSQVDTKSSIIFAAFSGEEYDLLGSKSYATYLVKSGMSKQLRSFVMLDMISYYKNHFGVLLEGSNANYKQKTALAKYAQLTSTYTALQTETSVDYGGSDHEPFLNRGMAGALLIESDWDVYPYYHTKNDRMIYQDIPYAVEVLKATAAILAQGGISSSAHSAGHVGNE